MGDSSSLFNTLASEVKDDPNLSVISSGQMFTGASIPFGVPSGLPKLDLAFGRPGWPAGRIIELYGFESCLAGNTFVQYSIIDSKGKVQNSKGGTLENLYNRFNKIPRSGKGNYQRGSTLHSKFYVPSINEEGRIIRNEVKRVYRTGEKECFSVKTALGYEIVATKDHRFFVGDNFVELENLVEGSIVFIHNNHRFKSKNSPKSRVSREFFVKNHPLASTKRIFDKKVKKTYEYKRLPEYRAIYEAHLNNISLEEYLERLNSGQLENLQFIQPGFHVHHVNDNYKDNRLENLSLIDGRKHNQLHSFLNHNKLRYEAIPDTIISISRVGIIPTYDITMESPFNNYVANNFVVHNSGKTTLGLTAIRNVQKMGGVGFFIDSEKTFDAYRAQSLDVELNYDDNFHRVEVRSMDAGFRAIKSICASVKKSGFDRPIVIVYDSVMGAANEYDIEQEIGAEQRTGHEAKVIKQGIRAISTDVSETKVLVFLINHAIENARASWGKKSKAAGGHAIKLWSSSRVELTGIGKITTSDRTSRTGQKVKIQLEKSKVGSLAITNFDVELLDATGFNTAASMLEAMEDVGMVSHTKGSKKFTLNPIEGVAEEAIEFEKKEWPKVLSSLGGEDKMYNLFYSYCFDKGLMRRYE